MARPHKRARIATPDDEESSPARDRSSSPTSSDDADESIAGVVLAILSCKARLGVAYHDFARSCLFVLEDALDTDKHDLAALIIEQVRPNVVLTSSKADDTLTIRLKKTLEAMQDELEDERIIQLRPRAEWNPKDGQQNLRLLRVHTGQGLADDDEMYGPDRVGADSVLDTSASPNMLGAVACLFNYYRRHPPSGRLVEPERGIAEVSSVERIALDKMLHINASALALQIFAEEGHGNAYSDRTKEGLSIFGLLNRTKTPMGKLLLRHWLLRPSSELSVIRGRHDALECFTQAANESTFQACRNALRGVKNVTSLLKTIKEGRCKSSTWMSVHKFLCASTMLDDLLRSLTGKQELRIVGKFSESFSAHAFHAFASIINDTVDWEESQDQGRICIKPLVDDELDDLKAQIAALDSKLNHIADKLSSEIPLDFADSMSILYYPQLGYLCVIPLKEEWEDPSLHAPAGDWTFSFVTESKTYWKNDVMRYCDEEWGDLHSIIEAREIEIAHELQERLVMDYETQMRNAAECMGELDVLFAMADAVIASNWVRPQMTQRNVCRIREGRHPLVERCVSQFVPNDIVLTAGKGLAGGEEPREADTTSVLLLTGANGSGKSVYLKAVALIVFLAHVGSFVPADEALIGITDAIYTRVSSVESASQDASAFTLDLQQVSDMLRNCTDRSLLIVDEFGKGTESNDGTGLLVGLIDHLVRRGVDTPKTIIATHFHSVFAHDLLDRQLPILLAHMELMIDVDEDDAQRSSITHLYRLAAGLAGTSHACQCAEANGIDRDITARAAHVTSLLSRHAINELLDAAMSESDKAELKAVSGRVRRFLELDFDALDDVHDALASCIMEEIEDL